jgi:hypothetical protein
VLGRREAGFDCPDIWHSSINCQKLCWQRIYFKSDFLTQASNAASNVKGAFPPSHFCNKLDDKLARKVALVSF